MFAFRKQKIFIVYFSQQIKKRIQYYKYAFLKYGLKEILELLINSS